MRSTRLFLALAVIGLLAMASLAHASTTQVSIKNYSYVPSEITISKGDTVTWKNDDDVIHDAKFGDSESPDLKKGETYSRTFDKPGTYDYMCTIHPSMKGKVIVK